MTTDTTKAPGAADQEIVHEITDDTDEYSDTAAVDDEDYGVGTEQGASDDGDADDVAIDMGQNFARDVLKPGTYMGVINETNFTKSQRSDQPMLVFGLTLEVPEKGDTAITWYGSFSPKAIAGTMRSLQTLCPQQIAQFTENGKFRPKRLAESSVLVGMPVRVITNVRLLDGEKMAGVRRIMKAGGGFQQA